MGEDDASYVCHHVRVLVTLVTWKLFFKASKEIKLDKKKSFFLFNNFKYKI